MSVFCDKQLLVAEPLTSYPQDKTVNYKFIKCHFQCRLTEMTCRGERED